MSVPNRLRFRTGLVAVLPTLLAITLVFATGCNSKKVQLQTELGTLGEQTDRDRQAISEGKSQLQALGQRLEIQRAQLREFNASVQGYMLDHKMAVAVVALGLAGADAALPSNNTYSQEGKDVGAAVAIVAAIWAVGHMDEVSEVLKVLNQADAHTRTLQTGIAQTSTAIEQQENNIQQTEEHLRLLSQRAESVQQELSQL